MADRKELRGGRHMKHARPLKNPAGFAPLTAACPAGSAGKPLRCAGISPEWTGIFHSWWCHSQKCWASPHSARPGGYDQTYVTPEHRNSVESLGYIYNNSQKYIVWVKIIDFYFMPKIIRILRSCSMNIFNTVNILKLNFGLVMHC